MIENIFQNPIQQTPSPDIDIEIDLDLLFEQPKTAYNSELLTTLIDPTGTPSEENHRYQKKIPKLIDNGRNESTICLVVLRGFHPRFGFNRVSAFHFLLPLSRSRVFLSPNTIASASVVHCCFSQILIWCLYRQKWKNMVSLVGMDINFLLVK
ncbi:unnamed protein product [Lactuca saligna]|uniref:Uncharacterized protein n=1 Tax=Lactuca saligna TaxID=75948 RepID=A0AA35UK55_LACSI|nr:unnamed protein product [Lactuca saligna]